VKEKPQWKDKGLKDLQTENRSLKEHVQKLKVRSRQTEEDVLMTLNSMSAVSA